MEYTGRRLLHCQAIASLFNISSSVLEFLRHQWSRRSLAGRRWLRFLGAINRDRLDAEDEWIGRARPRILAVWSGSRAWDSSRIGSATPCSRNTNSRRRLAEIAGHIASAQPRGPAP